MFDLDELVGQSIEVRIAGRQTATNGTITRHKVGSIYLVKLGRSRAEEIDMLQPPSVPWSSWMVAGCSIWEGPAQEEEEGEASAGAMVESEEEEEEEGDEE